MKCVTAVQQHLIDSLSWLDATLVIASSARNNALVLIFFLRSELQHLKKVQY